jgi:hypothetical protein
MPNDPSALKTLRKFYGDRTAYDGAENMETEFATANDRSIIISLAAIVDSALEYKLTISMPNLKIADEETYLRAFRPEGPMGGMAYKTEIAFHLGLIDADLRKQIDELRSIRNAVAHTHRIVSFSHRELQNAVRRLFAPRGWFPLYDHTPEGYRKTFIVEAGIIQPMITEGREATIAALRDSYIAAGHKPRF